MAAMFRVKFAETICKVLVGEKEELDSVHEPLSNAKTAIRSLTLVVRSVRLSVSTRRPTSRRTTQLNRNVITTQLPPSMPSSFRADSTFAKETKLTHGCTGLDPCDVESSRGATKRQSARDMFTKWKKVLATQGNEMIEKKYPQ